MATNPLEEEAPPTRAQQLASIFGSAKSAAVGSDYPLRVVVLFMAADLFVFLAQYWHWGTPLALLALMLLTLSWPKQR